MIPESLEVFPDSADSNSEITDGYSCAFKDGFGEECSLGTQESMNADQEDRNITGWSEDPEPTKQAPGQQQASSSDLSIVTASQERMNADANDGRNSTGLSEDPADRKPAAKQQQRTEFERSVVTASPATIATKKFARKSERIREEKLKRIRAVEESIGLHSPSTPQKKQAVRPKKLTARKSTGGISPAVALLRRRPVAESHDSESAVNDASPAHATKKTKSTCTNSKFANRRNQLPPARKSAGNNAPAAASKGKRAEAESQDLDSSASDTSSACTHSTNSTSSTSSRSLQKRKEFTVSTKASRKKRTRRSTTEEDDADYVFKGSVREDPSVATSSVASTGDPNEQQQSRAKRKRIHKVKRNDSLPPDCFLDYDGNIMNLKEYMSTKTWEVKDVTHKRVRKGRVEYCCEWEDTWETRRMCKAMKEYDVHGYPFKVLKRKTDIYKSPSGKVIPGVDFFLCHWSPCWEPLEHATPRLKRVIAKFEKRKKRKRR